MRGQSGAMCSRRAVPPVPKDGLNYHERGDRSGVGTKDARTERDGCYEGKRAQRLALVFGEAAFGADEDRQR